MAWLEVLGWVGSAILVWSLLQTRILRLRLLNLVGCLVLIVYNGIVGVWPMVGLNVTLAVINVVHLRGDETVGVVLVRDAGGGTAQVDLDYVTPRFRDFAPGEFVYRRSGLFRDHGFRRVLTPPGMVEPYFESIGFRREGEVYALDL